MTFEKLSRKQKTVFRWAYRPEAYALRSEEHTSELQSRFGIPYAVFCLKKGFYRVSDIGSDLLS